MNKVTFTTQKIAATYRRVSLDEQTTNYSPASQSRAMAKLAAEKGYKTAPEFDFEDDGFLGGEFDRPALTRLRKAVRAGLVQSVIVQDLDRLARSTAHLLLLTEEFTKYGVKLEIVNGSIEDSPSGKLMMTVRGAFSEYEKAKIRERTIRGRIEKAQQGFINGGGTPYGYRYEGKLQGTRGRWVVIPDEARVVVRMFEWVAAGVSLLDICKRLAEEGIRPRRAKQWTKPVITVMLANTTYYGEARYNRATGAEPEESKRRKPAPAGKSKKTSARKRPEAEWIIVPTPAIVSRELFDAVRQQMDRNRRMDSGRPSAYMLRGLIKCGKCGHACIVLPNHGYPRYRCSNIDPVTYKRRCDQASIALRPIETQVWADVNAYAANPRRLFQEHEREVGQPVTTAQQAKQAAELQKAIEKLSKQEFQATRSMMDPDLAESYDTFKAALVDCQKQRRALESQLTTLQPKPKARPAFVLPILEETYRQVLAAAQTPEERREAIRQRVERVDLHDTSIRITFKGDDDTNDDGISATNRIGQEPSQSGKYPRFSVLRKLA